MKNTGTDAVKRIFVKVYGFGDTERHALNTGFRLSAQRDVAYALWTADTPQSAEIVLLDGNSWEAALALANPENDGLKLVWIGGRAPPHAWKVFAGPLHWSRVMEVMDAAFRPRGVQSVTQNAVDTLDFSSADTQPITISLDGCGDDYDAPTAPMPLEDLSPQPEEEVKASAPVKRVLLVEVSSGERLYWRAKLAAAGLFQVDEATTAETALSFLAFNIYSLVIVDLDAGAPDVWQLIKDVMASRPAVGHLLVTRTGLSSVDAVRAWFAGANASFSKPVQPAEIKKLLGEIKARS